MSVTEVMQALQDIQSNWLAGSLVVLYYIMIYWPRLKDGFGIGKKAKVDLDRLEKHYKILQLKIQLEEQKEKSELDEARLKVLQEETLQETQIHAQRKRRAEFTDAQKFVAIPLLVVLALAGFWPMLQETSSDNLVDTLSGMVFIMLTVIVAFWGMPRLIMAKHGTWRTVGFICFWSIAFYIISYTAVFFIDQVIGALKGIPDQYEWLSHENWTGLYFLGSIGVATILGMNQKLPKMREGQLTQEPKQMA